MAAPDYRLPMTREAFDAIPIDPEYVISSLWDPLIDANPQLMSEDFGKSEFLAKVPHGMRTFLLLGVFDGQVCNGGLTHFFWNCRESIFLVRDALEEVGAGEVLELYDRALESLVGNREHWERLREEWSRLAPRDEAWEPFRKSYELLKLSWFDNAYFDEHGYDEVGKWVVIREGLQAPFARRLVEYVRARPEDFITGRAT